MTSTRLIFEIFLVLMWRPYCVQFCSLHILLYLIRQITGSDLSQTYVRKYYLHLGPDAGVSRGSSCVCTCISTVAMTLSEVIGFFFILRLTYILWQCAYIWHRPLGFTMTRDFGFLCIKIGFLCETRYSLRWWQYYHMLVMKFINGHDTFCAFSAELVHISVEKISEYHTLMDKPNLTLLYNASCVPSVTFLKHILYILSQFFIQYIQMP